MQKVTVILGGGLGNQMFQYAAARALQLENDVDIKLSTYLYDQNKMSGRYFSLHPFYFFTKDKLCSKNESEQAYERLNGMGNIYEKFLIKVLPFISPIYRKWLARRGIIRSIVGGTYKYQKIKLYCEDNVMFGGFQSPKYFSKYTDEIRKDLRVKAIPKDNNRKIIDQICSTESVCVHIRRGDFLAPEFQHLNVCTQEYYLNAMNYMKEHLNNPVFYIFSNTHEDIEWIKNNWTLSGQIYYVDENNCDYEELQIMYHCRHFIIANSTFSWWAQFLSENNDKIVCAPPIWDMEYLKDARDIYEKNWIIIGRTNEDNKRYYSGL